MRIRANTAVGGVLIALLAGTAIAAVFWTPFDPLRTSLRERLKPPSALHWLGTDEFGRDVLSRIMAGATTSAIIALVTVVLAVGVGVVIGGISGYRYHIAFCISRSSYPLHMPPGVSLHHKQRGSRPRYRIGPYSYRRRSKESASNKHIARPVSSRRRRLHHPAVFGTQVVERAADVRS